MNERPGDDVADAINSQCTVDDQRRAHMTTIWEWTTAISLAWATIVGTFLAGFFAYAVYRKTWASQQDRKYCCCTETVENSLSM